MLLLFLLSRDTRQQGLSRLRAIGCFSLALGLLPHHQVKFDFGGDVHALGSRHLWLTLTAAFLPFFIYKQ